jgi:hypothetical protein
MLSVIVVSVVMLRVDNTMTLLITTITIKHGYPECHYVRYHILTILMLIGIMVSVVMLSVDNPTKLSMTMTTIKYHDP